MSENINVYVHNNDLLLKCFITDYMEVIGTLFVIYFVGNIFLTDRIKLYF